MKRDMLYICFRDTLYLCENKKTYNTVNMVSVFGIYVQEFIVFLGLIFDRWGVGLQRR